MNSDPRCVTEETVGTYIDSTEDMVRAVEAVSNLQYKDCILEFSHPEVVYGLMCDGIS